MRCGAGARVCSVGAVRVRCTHGATAVSKHPPGQGMTYYSCKAADGGTEGDAEQTEGGVLTGGETLDDLGAFGVFG